MRAARELWSPLGAALALTAAVCFFDSRTLPWTGTAAVLLAAFFVATRGFPPGSVLLLPLGALAVWCALSIAWSIEPDRSWDYANRTFVYLAFALIGVQLAGRTRELAVGLAAVLGALCVWSLAGKVLPWLYEDYGRIARLRGPIGYWNVLALLGDIVLPLGLWLAVRRRIPGTLLVYGWAVAIALTYSRGGVVIAVIVVGAWLLLSGLWLQGIATLVSAGVPAAAVIGLAFSLSGVTKDGASHSTRVHDGLIFGAALLAGAGIAVALSRIPPPEPTLPVRRMATVFVIVVAAAASLAAGLHARTWWDEFTAPATTQLTNGPGRLAKAGSNHRWVWWKEAWRGFEQHKLAGTGAGSFEFTNFRYRTTIVDTATEPHDLPVQFLSETGAVGLGLFLLAGLALVYAARRPTDPEVALALILPAYLLHGLFDIDWDFAAVTGPVFLVAGALAARPLMKPRASYSTGLVAAGVALVALSSFFAVWLGNRWTGQAEEALGTNPAHAIVLAKRARSVQPLSVQPIFAQAFAEEELAVGTTRNKHKHLGRTLGLLRKATQLQPENKETWYALGFFDLEVRHCPQKALPELDRFTALDRQDPGNVEYARALKQVNSGKAVC